MARSRAAPCVRDALVQVPEHCLHIPVLFFISLPAHHGASAADYNSRRPACCFDHENDSHFVNQCSSLADYEYQMTSLRDPILIPETEETWDRIANAMIRMTALVRGNAADYPLETVANVRPVSRPLNSAASSERTRLSGVAIELLSELARVLDSSFDPLIPLFLPGLLTICTRSNKVFISRARSCVLAIIEHTRSPSILPYLAESTKDKSVSLRLAAAEATLACLNGFNPPDLEREPRAREIEGTIRLTATDASADVRKIAKKIFEAYKQLLPRRVERYVALGHRTAHALIFLQLHTATHTHGQEVSQYQSISCAK